MLAPPESSRLRDHQAPAGNDQLHRSPPAPVITMLGEVVVHGQDIRYPLGLGARRARERARLPRDVQGRQLASGHPAADRGPQLVATHPDWSHGADPEVTGPAAPMLLATTGRTGAVDDLSGDGIALLRSRMPRTS
jgi:hypothetical protein